MTEPEPPSVAALSVAETATEPVSQATEQTIDPWNVQAGVDADGKVKEFDYAAISQQWATKLIDDALLERFEKVTGHKPHRWLRRRLFFSHRDLDLILDTYERGDDFILYTGRGPSSDAMHIGHTIPFEFTKWLQDVFDVPLVIMLTDDEKYLFKEKLKQPEVYEFARQNAKDIISIGFDVKKTFMYIDSEFFTSGYNRHFSLNTTEFEKLITNNQVRGAFGFDGSTNIGSNAFAAKQCVAAFASSYPFIWGQDHKTYHRSKQLAAIPCFIPCAIDQDPYFRLLRENCGRMDQSSPKPALIHSKFLTALQGAGGKMSASVSTSAIFMSDSEKQVKNKISKNAFSGGQETMELHRELGGNPDIDVPYQYISYFEDDDEKLTRLAAEYRSGELLTGEMKKECIDLMTSYVKKFQDARAKVTDEILEEFLRPRKLEWKGNQNPTVKKEDKKEGEGDAAGLDADGKPMTKNAMKKAAKLAEAEKKKKEKATAAAAKV
ncbi:tryptophanyl-tRNA synthetase [Dothidotthia symphoricarpi CBS 119687]|uniref:Tryptophan--tRNA ligase, cytoplasmic n=1 Tax=Dothidotthia symphoricarpi CBS 119687 TaxID=1392245 RepID=A0A6A6AR33_9PLEO|nr:tryptophanyl-tRNA synthetase [Dothidotthia symphoricarpi CBS 119687]KAF2133673.1 tryptophanyl-tRNA synthetase [Dothidotthia symphoricarpi CBS 119687]